MMNKSTADPSGNYADYLAATVESNKDSFTDDELKTLTDDIETIRKIEEQIAAIEKDNTASDDASQKRIILTIPLLSRIFLVRIMMGILSTKALFSRKCSNCRQFLVYRL